MLAFFSSVLITWRRAHSSPLHLRLQVVLLILFIGTTANFFIDVYGTVLLSRGIGYSSNITHIIREQNIYNMIYVVHDGILGLNVYVSGMLFIHSNYINIH